MERWDLASLPSSTEKRTPREPGPDAPRVPRRDGQIPRVLFSSPECRVVVIELDTDEEMGDHRVRERAVVHVADGRVSFAASGETAECGAGSVVTFAPGEHHAVRALERSRLLLILAPWSGDEHLPANASVDPA